MSANFDEPPVEQLAATEVVSPVAKARRTLHPACATCVIQAVATTLGIIWGLRLLPFLPMFPSVHLAGISSLVMLGLGCRYAWRLTPPEPFHWSLALMIYVMILVINDPFLWTRGVQGAVINIMLLLPPLVAIGPCVRAGNLWSAWGAALSLAAGMAILIFNSRSYSSGIGFYGAWVS